MDGDIEEIEQFLNQIELLVQSRSPLNLGRRVLPVRSCCMAACLMARCSAGGGNGTMTFLKDAPPMLGNVDPVAATKMSDTPEVT